MKKTIFLNILFVFLTLAIIVAAALSALAAGGILKTSYGEKPYDAEETNDQSSSGIDNSLTFNPWGLYDENTPTIGEVLETNPEYLLPLVYTSDGKAVDYDINDSELAYKLVEYNRGLSILVKLCDCLFSYAAPPDDGPFSDEESMYKFLTEEVQTDMYYNAFFINGYEYTDKNGDGYILKAATTYNSMYYFRISPSEPEPLSINTADYISRYVPDWLCDVADIAYFESQIGSYTGEIPDITIPESPILDFCQALAPLLLDDQDTNYSVSVSNDVYTILGKFHSAFDRFYYYSATYENQLLIIFPPADLTQPSTNLILFYDPTLAKISGFVLTMYN